MKNKLATIIIGTIICAVAVLKADPAPVMVFAAASTADALKEIAAAFTDKTQIRVKINAGSSGDLARQLESGAPADVFLSASSKWMTYAGEKKLLKPGTAKPLMHGSLVIVAPKDSGLTPFELNAACNLPGLFKGRLSVGDPAHVPAGQYVMAALKYFKWDEALKTRLLPGKDVRAALMVVEMGEAELGIVYSTDARLSAKVKVVAEFPAVSHPPVEYLVGVCAATTPEGLKFYESLFSDTAFAIFKKYGFK